MNKSLIYESQKKSGFLSALLHFLIPGVGFFYTGKNTAGTVWTIVNLLLMLFTLGLAWLLLAPIFIIVGFVSASNANQRLVGRMAQETHHQPTQQQNPAIDQYSNHSISEGSVTHSSNVKNDIGTSQNVSSEDWYMKAKKTAKWKFILGNNFFKYAQLDYIQRRGDEIIIAVMSGKVCTFKIGEFKTKIMKAKMGLRDFRITSKSPKQKMTIRETHLQMPDDWWDLVATRLNASEYGISKFFRATQDTLDELKDN